MLRRLESLIPYARWLLPLVATVLFLPALFAPFMIDDWVFLAALEGLEVFPERGPWSLFHLDTGDEVFPGGVQGSLYQWWMSPDFRAHFFRPLSSITHAIDHAVWGRNAVGHHATSLAFYAVLVGLVGALYRRMTTPLLALVAGLIFAMDDTHTWPVAWIANRNAVLAVIGAAGLLYAHHRWRQGGGGRWLALGLVSYAAGLASAEAALAGVGYVVAYEVCIPKTGLGDRVRSAAPAVVLACAYLVFWKIGGYGTRESWVYLNPFEEPVQYALFAVPTRVPLLLLGALTPAPVDVAFVLSPSQAWAAAGVAGCVCVALLAPLLPLFRRDPLARMFLLGALISLLPISATLAATRNLMLPTLGISYVLARAIVDGLRGEGPRWLAYLLIGFHLVLAPLATFGGVGAMSFLLDGLNDEAFEADIPTEGVEDLRVAVLNTQAPMTGLYLQMMWAVAGNEVPAAIWPLVAAPVDQEIVRKSSNSIRLRSAWPGYLTTPFELLMRRDHVVRPGEVWTSGGLTVEAVEVRDGRLLAFEVTFDRDIGSDDLRLLAFDGERLAEYTAPDVGECALLALPKPLAPPTGAARPPPADLCVGMNSVGAASSPAAAAPPLPLPAGSPPPSPAVPPSLCSLDLLTSDGWVARAAVACPGADGLGIVSAGDIGYPGELLTASTDRIAALCATEPCHLLAMPGDLMYVPGEHAEEAWRLIWDRTLARAGLPGLGVLGNHEYRHEPDPAGKRAALYAAHGRAGFELPSASWTMRIRRGDESLFAVVGLDTDSVANPGPDMPGLGLEALAAGCALDVPTIVLGHHPTSSQGAHHGHEAHVEQAMARTLRESAAGGCRIAAYLAGHDHDLQAWPTGCEAPGDVGTVVSGVAARGFRKGGSTHLSPCPASGAEGSYHAGLPGGGFALLRIGNDASVEARLYHMPSPGQTILLSTQRW